MNSPSLGYILQYYYWHRIHIYFQITMTTLVENSQAQLTESIILHKSFISTLFSILLFMIKNGHEEYFFFWDFPSHISLQNFLF